MKTLLAAFFINASLPMVAPAAVGDVINVQFMAYPDGIYTGTGAAGGGSAWNQFSHDSGVALHNLFTSTRVDSTVDFAATYLSGFFGGLSGSSAGALLGNGLYGTAAFTFSDLNLSDTYALYFYVSNKAAGPTQVSVTTPGGGTQTPFDVTIRSSFVLDGNYVVFSGLTPDASGRISGGVAGDWTGLNGLQLVTTGVPEPGTAFLLSFGIFCSVGVRRRAPRGR